MTSDGRADCTHDRRFYALVLLATFASPRRHAERTGASVSMAETLQRKGMRQPALTTPARRCSRVCIVPGEPVWVKPTIRLKCQVRCAWS
jgi:hypothetical protein